MDAEVEVVRSLEQKIEDKTASLGVIGLGYVGLPLAVEMASAGFHVTGFDIKAETVEALGRGESHIPDVKAERVAQHVDAGLMDFTTDMARMAEMDVLSICVPTPLDPKSREPDLSYVKAAAGAIAECLRPGQLVVLESTTYPGTTDEVVLPVLRETGLVVGVDFFLAFSPERVDPGNTKWQTRNTPKVVGGVTEACTANACAVYKQFIDTLVPVSGTRVAEMTKLLENTFRGVNIALVNELLLLCDRMGIDMFEVIDAAKTKPFGFTPFYPGPGPGGHCIPIDPFYLSWKARQYEFRLEFIEAAGKLNEYMPYHVREKVIEALNLGQKALRGSNVLVLGVAYKKDIDDPRESPAKRIMELLDEWGAVISYHDSYVQEFRLDNESLRSVDLNAEVLAAADCVVVVTDHSDIDYEELVAEARLVVDCRHACPNAENVVRI
ncbi:MAG: nucleotide sugar dehydrogenase [Actinobacteria bacterium]|jgi:UDP-N-acetyl-D-glucosamine dehydrogenase|nr:MAG: nucleotide sugar dehydrogenase [Actinomycetota bacterium]